MGVMCKVGVGCEAFLKWTLINKSKISKSRVCATYFTGLGAFGGGFVEGVWYD